jgi:hypothetical protein
MSKRLRLFKVIYLMEMRWLKPSFDEYIEAIKVGAP